MVVSPRKLALRHSIPQVPLAGFHALERPLFPPPQCERQPQTPAFALRGKRLHGRGPVSNFNQLARRDVDTVIGAARARP